VSFAARAVCSPIELGVTGIGFGDLTPHRRSDTALHVDIGLSNWPDETFGTFFFGKYEVALLLTVAEYLYDTGIVRICG
jgi:hypothetical protein